MNISGDSSLRDIGEALAGCWAKSESSAGRYVALGSVVIATSRDLSFPFSVTEWRTIGEGLHIGFIDTRKATR